MCFRQSSPLSDDISSPSLFKIFYGNIHDIFLKQRNRRRGAPECSKSGKAAEELSAVSGRFGEGGGGAEENPGQDLPYPQPQK